MSKMPWLALRLADRRPKMHTGETTFIPWLVAEWFSSLNGMSGIEGSRPSCDNEFLNRSLDIILTCLS